MRYTAAQVGVGNTPAAHLSTTAPELAASVDLNGDENTLPGNPIGNAARGWRTVQMGGSAAPATIALGDADHTRLDEHARTGERDRRRTDEARSGHPSGEDLALAPMVVEYHNERTHIVVAPEAAPDRPRQGFTGADPTRAAQMVRPYVLRPFDKGMAEHPTELDKVEFASPLATRPREYGAIGSGYPTAGGSTGTDRPGIGIQPNTFRIMPQAWDRLLVNTGGAAASEANPDPAYTAAAARGRTFR